MKHFPNYPDLLKFFYRHNFPSDLGSPATSVALAIIYKSNELIWPPKFKMSNTELSNLSGERLSNIGRTRQKVLDRCEVGGVPLFTYVDNGNRRAGTYIINFNLASTYSQLNVNLTSNSSQNTPLIDNDHNLTQPNETTTDAETLVNLMQEKWPHPNPPSEVVVKRMIGKYKLSVCVDAMDSTPTDMDTAKWDSIFKYMRKVAESLTPKVPPKVNEEKDAINKLKHAVADYRTIDGNERSRTGATPNALINVMRPYAQWYDRIDNLGDIVGMQFSEYDALINGGAK